MSYSASSEFTDLVSAKLALIEDELGRQAGADTPFVTEAANHARCWWCCAPSLVTR